MKDFLAKLFGSNARTNILALFYRNPQQVYYQREIMLESGLALQAAQRELANLHMLGVIKRNESANRVYYELNPEFIHYRALQDIFGKKEEAILVRKP
jgi:hypothetical protein